MSFPAESALPGGLRLRKAAQAGGFAGRYARSQLGSRKPASILRPASRGGFPRPAEGRGVAGGGRRERGPAGNEEGPIRRRLPP